MDHAQAMAFIHGTEKFGSRLGLARMRELCALLGDPQKNLRCVHVAGTNGKGSTVTMIACALEDAGYKVGKYTSPYVYDFRERIEINGKMISKESLARLTARVRAACERMEDHPTEFEIVTAIAFLYYAEEQCDYAVLEVGLGGRLDATNVIKAPLVSVICSISLDHTNILGDTLEKIAFEKAGIIKKGCPCAVYPDNPPQVTALFGDVCRERKSALYMADLAALTIQDTACNRCRFAYRGVDYAPSLLGRHQIYNALTAVTALEQLGIPARCMQSGIARAALHGRYEIISDAPRIIVDAGHNPSGVEALASAVRNDSQITHLTLIFGMLADKDYPTAIKTLASVAGKVICLTPDSPRALPASRAQAVASLYCGNTAAFDDAACAVREALCDLKNGTLLICGSFYVIDKTVKELERQLNTPLINQ